MNNNVPCTSEGKLERIPICDLVYNSNLPLNFLRIPTHTPIVKDDKLLIPPVVVCRRDGVNYIVDGQHTIDIVVSITGSRETAIWCKVFDDPAFEQEEDIFPNPTDAMLGKEEIQ